MTSETVTLIDDSVLVQDLGAVSILTGKIVLPEFAMRRLGNPKNYPSNISARNAETASSYIEQLTHEHPDKILTGMPIDGSKGSTLSIYIGNIDVSDKEDPAKLMINVANKIKNKLSGSSRVVIISQNRSLLIRARLAGFEANLYQASLDPKNFYTGHRILDADLLEGCDENGDYTIRDSEFTFYDNECVTFANMPLKDFFKTNYCSAKDKFIPLKSTNNTLPVQPLNIEQEYAFGLLRNPEIDLVTLNGPYGTGKDLCALSYAMAAKLAGKFKRIVLVPSPCPVGDYKHETLPGDINEKSEPFLGPYIDNIASTKRLITDKGNWKKLFNILNEGWTKMIADQFIEVQPLAYMRGRTFDDCCLILTEAHNITQPDTRLVISRIGINSKFIFTGDIAQLDTRFDFSLSGFTRLIDRFKDDELVGNIKLVDCVRSRGARLAAKY